MTIELIDEPKSKTLDIAQRALWLCHQLGIRCQSHNFRDYERAKSYLRTWDLDPADYDIALKAVVDYLQV